jgi:hypothetical protein
MGRKYIETRAVDLRRRLHATSRSTCVTGAPWAHAHICVTRGREDLTNLACSPAALEACVRICSVCGGLRGSGRVTSPCRLPGESARRVARDNPAEGPPAPARAPSGKRQLGAMSPSRCNSRTKFGPCAPMSLLAARQKYLLPQPIARPGAAPSEGKGSSLGEMTAALAPLRSATAMAQV